MGPKSEIRSPGPDSIQSLDDIYKLATFDKQIPPSLDILSSSTYYDYPPLPSPYSDPAGDQYFGVVVYHTDADKEETSQKKSRASEIQALKSSVNALPNGAAPKKQRGRPRIDPQEESPAEKRRAQVRLAQRAYRDRRESTISDLQGQIAEMQRNVDDMSRTFLQLYANLYNSGLLDQIPIQHPAIQLLEQMMVDFTEASRVVDQADS